MSRVVKPIQLLPALVGLILLNGCSSTAVNQGNNGGSIATPPISSSEENIENYHVVKRGESLYGIARMYGRDHKDLARWNNIPPPYALNIGQRLILDGPPADDNSQQDNYESEISTPTIEEPPVAEGKHRVAAGETLFAIAQKYGKNWRDLAKWNNLQEPYGVNAGQILVVEAPADYIANNDPITTPTVEPVTNPAPSNNEKVHTVLPGDTLFKIAKHYGLNMIDLAKWNNIPPPYSVQLNQKLRLTAPEGIENTLPSALPEASNSDYHIVQAKDTLYSISKVYNISIANLKLWNNLQPPFNVFIGQKLRITPPATSSSSGDLSPVVLNPIPSYHIAESGESLKQIAQKYGLSLSDVAKWNGIGSPYNIYPGQRLKLAP
jgi:peptidoglycan endopeptidase LytF